jgi:hypothetical protein
MALPDGMGGGGEGQQMSDNRTEQSGWGWGGILSYTPWTITKIALHRRERKNNM